MFIVFQFGIYSFLHAQHYIFIEAEGQQPFYLKRGGETFSSTGSGFIILSKINQKEIDFIIGFPNKLYPEVAFKIAAIQQDRGFALKKIQGKDWALEDRQTLGLIKGGPVDEKADEKAVSQSSAVSTAGFADLLAEATGDKSLLEKSTLITLPADKPVVSNNKPKPNSTVSKTPTATKQPSKSTSLGIVRSYIQSEDSSLLRIAYFEKGAKNNWDTIIVEIEKITKTPLVSKALVQDKLPNSPTTISPIVKEVALDSPKQTMAIEIAVGCSNPIALPRDVKELQRKMNKASSFEVQLELATKAFNEKCFTTKQVKELGSLFWEEQNKLTFYSRLRKFVGDPSLYGELEQSFLQEGSKKAFREMLKQQQL
ncbi:MAG: hypothetical protein RLZZ390_244 [Bacteroidota bacterium]